MDITYLIANFIKIGLIKGKVIFVVRVNKFFLSHPSHDLHSNNKCASHNCSQVIL